MEELFPYFNGFTYSDAFPHKEGITRRDPSSVIRAGDLYYVWYSRTPHSAGGHRLHSRYPSDSASPASSRILAPLV
jgi:hypothetical protein